MYTQKTIAGQIWPSGRLCVYNEVVVVDSEVRDAGK